MIHQKHIPSIGLYVGLKLFVLILLFLSSLQLLVLSCKALNMHIVGQMVIVTSNPFIALFIGILITALIQSSSTVTAIIVAVVASDVLPLSQAVFVIMGANIGTTLTSTLVSLGHITSKKEFRKAMAAATAHDFFNIFTAFLLFPAEYYFGFLSNLSIQIASFLLKNNGFGLGYIFNALNIIWDNNPKLFLPQLKEYVYIYFFIALLMLFFVIRGIAYFAKNTLETYSPYILEKYLFTTPIKSLFSGIFITALLHSSSLVTSLVVPIVAHNKASIKKIFPFLMGANIGTTITALMASIGQNHFALSIAITHLLFNVIGVVVFFPIPKVRLFIVNIARGLGKISTKNRWVGLAYITSVFFLIPFLLIYFSKNNIKVGYYTYHFPKDSSSVTDNMNSVLFFPINQASNDEEVVFYKQTNTQKNILGQESVFVHFSQEKFQKIMFLNDIPFPLGDQPILFQDKKGKFKVELLKTIKNYSFGNYKTTNCKVFILKYINNNEKNISKNLSLTQFLSAEHYFFIDDNKHLLIKYEMKQKNVVKRKEEIIFLER